VSSTALSSSGYYRLRKVDDSKREKENKKLLWQIRLVHKKHKKRYSIPRIIEELQDNVCYCSENRIARLMRKNGIAAMTKRKFKVTINLKYNLPIAENIVNRDFSAITPNCLWSSDITYIHGHLKDGFIFCNYGRV
jgi:putative transposase